MHRWLATVKTIAQCLTYMYVLVNNIWELVMVDLGSPHVLQLILAAQLFRSGCLLCLFPVLITTVLSINSSALSVCCATQSVPMVILGCALCPLVSVWLLYRYYDFCCFFCFFSWCVYKLLQICTPFMLSIFFQHGLCKLWIEPASQSTPLWPLLMCQLPN